MIEAEGGRRQRWTAATTAADGGAPDGTDAACTGTPGTSRQVVSQGDAGLTLLRSLEPDDPRVLSPPTRTSSDVPLRRRNWSFFFWFILLSSFLFEFRSISEDFCAFSSDRWKEKRSSKFQLDRFPVIFDQISNPSRFYQISIRTFLVSFNGERNIFLIFLNLVYQILDVSLLYLFFFFILWKCNCFLRIKSANHMFDSILYIRIYSRIRWFPGDFNERLANFDQLDLECYSS